MSLFCGESHKVPREPRTGHEEDETLKKLLLGAVTGAMALAAVFAPQAAHAGRTETRTYVAAGGDYLVHDFNRQAPGTPTQGGASFDFRSGDTGVTIKVADAAGPTVAFYWQYNDDNDDPLADSLGYGDVCGGSHTIPKVAGATGVTIFIDQAWQLTACPPGKHLPGTAGTITATFKP